MNCVRKKIANIFFVKNKLGSETCGARDCEGIARSITNLHNFRTDFIRPF